MNLPIIYVINMKKDIDKRNYMQKKLKNMKVVYKLIDAVGGDFLTDEFVNSHYSKSKTVENIGRELSRREIGCAISHISIYKEMVEKDIEKAVILEDDIDFDQNIFKNIIENEDLPKNWECIMLGHHNSRSRKIEAASSLWYKKSAYLNFQFIRFIEHAYGAYGYIISSVGAKKLLKHLSLIDKPIDHYMGNSEIINLYGISPSCVNIADKYKTVSNLSDERKKLDDRSLKKLSNNKSFKKTIAYILRKVNFLDKVKWLLFHGNKLKPLRRYYTKDN